MNREEKESAKKKFREHLLGYSTELRDAVSNGAGEWAVKGFIDTSHNIYTISADTKVVSKIVELMLFPRVCKFAEQFGYKLLFCDHQNHYPDMTFIDSSGLMYAVDMKSTYRKTARQVNGMTLGAFTGYFRNRTSTKNVKFPYGQYAGHFVLGLVYSRFDEVVDEGAVYTLKDIEKIPGVIKDFQFFVQEKYQIAVDRPGSGNTKNIGSVVALSDLINGRGPFASLGEEAFDDYWMHYLTSDMARAEGVSRPPYRNLSEYKVLRKK